MPKSKRPPTSTSQHGLLGKTNEFDFYVRWVDQYLPSEKHDIRTTKLKRIRAELNRAIKRNDIPILIQNGKKHIEKNHFLTYAYNVKGWAVLRPHIDKLTTIVNAQGVAAYAITDGFEESGGVAVIPQDKSQKNLIHELTALQLKAQHKQCAEKKMRSETARKNAQKRNNI